MDAVRLPMEQARDRLIALRWLVWKNLEFRATGREQVLFWDDDVMYVYGADDAGKGARTLRRFPPEYNRSNYRGEALLPG